MRRIDAAGPQTSCQNLTFAKVVDPCQNPPFDAQAVCMSNQLPHGTLDLCDEGSKDGHKH